MLTTHSPFFIDLAKDHTTIVRAEKGRNDAIGATTLFSPDIAQLSVDDKENLKLHNLFDSHISEAFFGGKILVVEGDTEYAAFNYIRSKEISSGSNHYKDINIIRARGKVTVASMMKVLNHFKAKYYVLHDTDRQTTRSKVKDRAASTGGQIVYREKSITNPAWTNNQKVADQMSVYSRVIASMVNFEEAYFSEIVESNKPENCLNHLKSDIASYQLIKKLLDSILEFEQTELPEGAIQWSTVDEIDRAITAWDQKVTILSADE